MTRHRSAALVGNPNAGKSALFNALTGARQKIANYPGVTVERKSGRLILPSGQPIELTDLPGAYGIWVNDKNWQQHPNQFSYPYSRFESDWSSSSPDSEYGAIHSHKIALAARYGNGLLVATLINDRKSGALDLTYDSKTGTLSFAPPGVSLYLGP